MQQINTDKPGKKVFCYAKGVTFFTKKTERNLFFILTLIMLLWGILVKFDFLAA